MKTYGEILDGLLRLIEERDGIQPTEVSAKYQYEIAQGMAREAICQILADEPEEIRKKYLDLYRGLRIHYRRRIRTKEKK